MFHMKHLFNDDIINDNYYINYIYNNKGIKEKENYGY